MQLVANKTVLIFSHQHDVLKDTLETVIQDTFQNVFQIFLVHVANVFVVGHSVLFWHSFYVNYVRWSSFFFSKREIFSSHGVVFLSPHYPKGSFHRRVAIILLDALSSSWPHSRSMFSCLVKLFLLLVFCLILFHVVSELYPLAHI